MRIILVAMVVAACAGKAAESKDRIEARRAKAAAITKELQDFGLPSALATAEGTVLLISGYRKGDFDACSPDALAGMIGGDGLVYPDELLPLGFTRVECVRLDGTRHGADVKLPRGKASP